MTGRCSLQAHPACCPAPLLQAIPPSSASKHSLWPGYGSQNVEFEVPQYSEVLLAQAAYRK